MSFEWEHVSPEAAGMDRQVLMQLDDYLKQHRYRLVNCVLVVRNGKIVWESYYNRYHADSRNPIKSIWKSIMALTTGICLDRGLIGSLDDPVSLYLPAFGRSIHPYHKLMTIRHLLTMTSGIYWNGGVHYHCPMMTQLLRSKDWVEHLADVQMASVPGMSFQYKEFDVVLLSAVISRATGAPAYEIARQYLYEPLQIQSGRWPESSCGISYNVMKGEVQSDLSARDLAKFGLLMHGNGIFDGQTIISPEFIREITAPSNPNYGFLWVLLRDGYGARGYGGQEINVVPELDLITVIQATPTDSSKSYGDIHEQLLKPSIIS
ncbi:serine hydrolase domain-containing protein [Paenibacillus terricola]|nr:serine hydrolase [Paenibacillus terricola]